MVKNNKIFFKNLKNVVIFGFKKNLKEIIDYNKLLNIKTYLINNKKKKIQKIKNCKIHIFKELKSNFEKKLKKDIKVDETLFISFGSRYIFKKRMILDFFKRNIINFYPTRLPLDAGGADISWKIMKHDRICNQLCHLVDENIDTGPIISNRSSIIPKALSTPEEIANYQEKQSLVFYKDLISKLSSGQSFNLVQQPKYFGSYNPRLNTLKDGFIDWNFESLDLINFINAFDAPYQGASTFVTNKKFKKVFIKKVQLHGGDGINHPYMAGLIQRHDKNWIIVSTASKFKLIIEEVYDENNTNIINSLKVGDRFYTPVEFLDNSKKKRTIIK